MPENFIERPRKNEKDDAIQYVKSLLTQAREDNRNEDIEKLEELVRLLHTKKYGLVWEEHAEIVEEEMKTKIPVFVEDAGRKIVGNPDSEDYNFLLEGDNLHSLHLLEKTHSGKIDVIYIDPPYNTGNKDFIYNDKIVDKTDGYSHSKWLSFMSKRLEIARNLLSDKGVIFISIDDNEQAQLKLLCDEIFDNNNFLGTIIQNKQNAKNDSVDIQKNHEYIHIYRKKTRFENGSKSKILPTLVKNEKKIREVVQSEEGFYYIGDSITTRGEGGTLRARPNLGYVVYYHEDSKEKIAQMDYDLDLAKESNQEEEVYSFDSSLIEKGYIPILPPKVRGNLGCWTWSIDKFNANKDELIITKGRDRLNVKKLKFVDSNQVSQVGDKFVYFEIVETNSRSIIEFSTNDGTNELNKLIGRQGIFNNPKNLKMIGYFISLLSNRNLLVLDFFAGSGTTGHAVAQLNKEDGGNRKYILCTNNENRIAEEVTYKRLSNIQSDLPHNLKYFKTDFVDKTEFPDFTLESELLNYITPLVELEFGIDISNPSVQIILTEEHLEALLQNHELQAGATLFIHPDVFLDTKEQEQLSELQITLQEIPDYFFGKELWS
ncbi:site-specific DNA-methyltransferase [Streptococcus iniae]|uniref:site-specific DNA-methyltransferase n=1 Tax=Streptococcus iniae TaxID=1346 RepID=UPI000EF70456|nr:MULTISPECIES: site-specific DNA-methyltransferase [Streptococcus]QGG97754.1 site-specific DNA-methyltransferase [Streptococcus dysgalactiae subsp. dysgalactiae]RLU51346.1 site-specific DNA-methyltransferase [Streptococcus iniae]RLU60010.1 site-specific DNA-methyltransferase [Streptococcus iniae]RLU62821.1 site-specific DNA-methyltransferase [Streptococcus iniae]RLU72547.1 site-specific DNA-methyltransferase [Streptococcus iniae]